MSTIKDVSRRTGLSISTISKYLNGGNVLASNRRVIEDAIRDLDYKVNRAARCLKTNRTMTVGVLLPSLDVSFFAGIVTDMEETLLKAGYNTIVCSYNHAPAQETDKLRFLVDQRVDGIILVSEGISAEDILSIRELKSGETPLVLLDRVIPNLFCDAVVVDNVLSCESAVEQFVFSGHKKIGIITGPENVSTAIERLRGYKNALRACGITPLPEWIQTGAYTLESGYRCMNEFMRMSDAPTAILCTNYEMTLGAITAAHENSLRIPDDFSFIGYDELQLTKVFNPPITIVLQPTGAMGAETTRLLLNRMGGDAETPPQKIVLKSRLLINKSVRTLR